METTPEFTNAQIFQQLDLIQKLSEALGIDLSNLTLDEAFTLKREIKNVMEASILEDFLTDQQQMYPPQY